MPLSLETAMTRSFHPPLYTALKASFLAFLLADVFTPRTAHSAMSINLCNHSGPDFGKIAARPCDGRHSPEPVGDMPRKHYDEQGADRGQRQRVSDIGHSIIKTGK